MAPSSPRRNSACWTLLASAGCFIALALAVTLVDPFPGDAAARRWLLGYGSPAVVEVARVVNYLGSWRVWIGLMLAAPAAEGLLKIVIGRARPEESSMGFPSGHATAAAAFFGAVIYLAGSLPPPARLAVRAASVFLIVLVALARIILRAHWPVDTLAGIALGLFFASLATVLNSPARDRAPTP